MAGKKYLNNITFTPTLANYSVIMNNISNMAELDGYVATTKKDMAKIVLSGPDDDPILATWQYGIGRSVAFTSDLNGIFGQVKIVDSPKDIYKGKVPNVVGKNNMSRLLLILALIVFLIEIILRKAHIKFDGAKNIYAKIISKYTDKFSRKKENEKIQSVEKNTNIDKIDTKKAETEIQPEKSNINKLLEQKRKREK